jgi:hypothetical protein
MVSLSNHDLSSKVLCHGEPAEPSFGKLRMTATLFLHPSTSSG